MNTKFWIITDKIPENYNPILNNLNQKRKDKFVDVDLFGGKFYRLLSEHNTKDELDETFNLL